MTYYILCSEQKTSSYSACPYEEDLYPCWIYTGSWRYITVLLKNVFVAGSDPFVQFLRDIKYVVLFYVVGDFITTYHALDHGFEENPFLAILMSEFGIWSMLIMKFLFIGIIYWYYCTIMSTGSAWKNHIWLASRSTVSLLGLFLVVNNLLVIFSKCSLVQFLGFAS